MTWEADIVNRSGKLSISGEFKISSASEFQRFIDKMNELASKSVLRQSSATARLKHEMRDVEPRKKDEVIVRVFNERGKELAQDGLFPKKLPSSINIRSREKQVFDFYHSGLTRRQMADRMGVTPATVDYCFKTIRQKVAREGQ